MDEHSASSPFSIKLTEIEPMSAKVAEKSCSNNSRKPRHTIHIDEVSSAFKNMDASCSMTGTLDSPDLKHFEPKEEPVKEQVAVKETKGSSTGSTTLESAVKKGVKLPKCAPRRSLINSVKKIHKKVKNEKTRLVEATQKMRENVLLESLGKVSEDPGSII